MKTLLFTAIILLCSCSLPDSSYSSQLCGQGAIHYINDHNILPVGSGKNEDGQSVVVGVSDQGYWAVAIFGTKSDYSDTCIIAKGNEFEPFAVPETGTKTQSFTLPPGSISE